MVIFPGESTAHTGRKRTSAELLNAAPLRASLLGFCVALFPHACGSGAEGGETVGSRCYFSRVGSVFAQPESTCRSDKKPIMANQFGRAPRRQRRLGVFSAGVDYPRRKLPDFWTQRRLGRVFSDLYPAASFHSDGTVTQRREKSGDDAISKESGPFLLRWSRRHRVGKTNVGADIAWRGHFGGTAIAFSSADLPVRVGKKRRSPTS